MCLLCIENSSLQTAQTLSVNQKTPLYETDSDKFAGPTSCIVGQGLGFTSEDLLVTEGVIVTIDPNTCFGNWLSTVKFEE